LEEVVGIAQFASNADYHGRLVRKLSALEEVCSSREDISIITGLNAKFAVDFFKQERQRAEKLINQQA
jgi:hypothetical protein